MDYFCDVCDELNTFRSKRKHLQIVTQIKYEGCVRAKHTKQNIEFSDIDSVFQKYTKNHNEKLESYLAKNDFETAFKEEITTHIKVDQESNLSNFHLKCFFLHCIEHFSQVCYKFSHISEMCRTNVRPIINMTNENY